MKTVKSIAIITMMTFLFASFANAQGLQYVKIKTSAVSDLCKDKIEKGLAYEKGVKDVDLDLETKVVTVQYSEKKTNYDKLVKVINELGYDADDTKADAKAYSELPDECKKTVKKDCGSKYKYKTDCSKKCGSHKK